MIKNNLVRTKRYFISFLIILCVFFNSNGIFFSDKLLAAVTPTTYAELAAMIQGAPTDGTLFEISLSSIISAQASDPKITIQAGQNVQITGQAIVGLGPQTFTIASGGKLTIDGCVFRNPGFDIYGDLVMDGGSIEYWNYGWDQDAKADTSMKSLIRVFSGGTFTMNGGKFFKNRATEKQSKNSNGLILVYGGTFNMNGGEISGNLGTYTAGAVMVYQAGSVFNMNGGTISGNEARGEEHRQADASGNYFWARQFSYGGGVSVLEGAQFNLSAGSIENNIAVGSGGGVFVSGAGSKFLMTGGKISGNQALTAGGDGSTAGGGVSVIGGGQFEYYGGEISGNSSQVYGGGVYVSTSATMITKDILVTGNTAENTGNVIKEEQILSSVLPSIATDQVRGKNSSAQGGGIWHCEMGNAIVESGASIGLFDNSAVDGPVGIASGQDLTILKHSPNAATYQIQDFNLMPAGGSITWYEDGQPLGSGTVSTRGQNEPDSRRYDPAQPGTAITDVSTIVPDRSLSLIGIASDEDKTNAQSMAKALVTNNSALMGGGLAINGNFRVLPTETYNVTHSFESTDSAYALPEALHNRTPQDVAQVPNGKEVYPGSFDNTNYFDLDTQITWIFTSWDTSSQTISDQDVHFIGYWTPVFPTPAPTPTSTPTPTPTPVPTPVPTPLETTSEQRYRVVHDMVSGTTGRELPKGLLERTPKTQIGLLDGDMVYPGTLDTARYLDPNTKEVWVFKGWDFTEQKIEGRDAKFIAIWELETSQNTSTVTASTTTPPEEVPKTGESPLAIYAGILSVLGGACVILLRIGNQKRKISSASNCEKALLWMLKED